jgi:hypothetical protein
MEKFYSCPFVDDVDDCDEEDAKLDEEDDWFLHPSLSVEERNSFLSR